MRYIYQALFEHQDDGTILVTVPDVPMVATFGSTEDEARLMAADALGTALRSLLKQGEFIPRAVTPPSPGLVPVELDVDDALKVAVIEAFREARISKTELGRRLNRADTEAHRILDPDHKTKAGMLTQALAALGKRASVEFLDAA